MKKKILLFVAVFALVLSTTACGKKNNENNPDNPSNNTNKTAAAQPSANTNADVISGAVIDGLRIGNVSLISTGEHTEFTADVVNTTEADVDVKSFDIILRDANGQQVEKMLGYVGNTLAPNNSATMRASVEKNLSSVTSIEYIRNY